MHPLLRKFAREKLSVLGTEQETSHRHAVFFSRFLTKQLPLLKGGGQTRAMEQIKAEYDHCCAAWLWAIDQERGEIVDEMIDVLGLFLQFQAWDEVGTELFQLARERWPAHTVNAARIAGRLSVRFPAVSEPEARTATLQRVLTIAEDGADLSEIAFCQRELGLHVGHRGPMTLRPFNVGYAFCRPACRTIENSVMPIMKPSYWMTSAGVIHASTIDNRASSTPNKVLIYGKKLAM
jgi:hypothetical protein